MINLTEFYKSSEYSIDIKLSQIASRPFFEDIRHVYYNTEDVQNRAMYPKKAFKILNGDNSNFKFLTVEKICDNDSQVITHNAQIIGSELFLAARISGCTEYDPVISGLPVVVTVIPWDVGSRCYSKMTKLSYKEQTRSGLLNNDSKLYMQGVIFCDAKEGKL